MSAEEYLKRVGLIQSPQISQERVIKHMESYAREYHAKEMERNRSQNVIMKFKDAPVGARFRFIGDDTPKDVFVKINAYGDGLVVKWNGNVQGNQSHYCWLDEENGYDFDTEIELI